MMLTANWSVIDIDNASHKVEMETLILSKLSRQALKAQLLLNLYWHLNDQGESLWSEGFVWWNSLKGPVVPVNVCFGDDDSLDIGAMRKYVNWLCEQRIPVILLTYGSSEFCSLTDKEIWQSDCGTGRRNIRSFAFHRFNGLVAPRTVRESF